MSKSKLIAIVLVGVAIGGSIFFSLYQAKQNKLAALPDKSFGWKFPVAQFPLPIPSEYVLAYSNIRISGVPQGLPVRLQIPTIGVDALIEDALITPDGRMDVPANSVNVAWFALGPKPGDIGSAVVGGHYGIENNIPFVFYNLNKLVVGDKIFVVNDKGQTIAFQVREIKSFDQNADATSVFVSTDGLAHLNLVTCEGVWNKVDDNYPSRLVIFADAVK